MLNTFEFQNVKKDFSLSDVRWWQRNWLHTQKLYINVHEERVEFASPFKGTK